ncbi:hypothetical protein DFJ58DRAFT_865341 [Suillus subalutaceus]|uniref:uncharacterized protein n=1 Tax=Suillus subalutaceus TaxID=48586 RepID=UPI001B85FDDA|nr:uncharacterized protein DFJ58DRAFT_865341 [Suillus subalutaceus]KAG1876418.1 hypothetical protein DFJ58DRAFT_865341 [Suillus subalutaceus]
MTALKPMAKSSSDWTRNELAAYNIKVDYQDAATFFEIDRDNLPQPDINPDILTTSDPNDVADDDVSELLRTMEFAMSPAPAEESAVDDFTVLLLRALGYTKKRRVPRTRKVNPFVVCSEDRHAETDVCIIDENGILLLVMQEDKCHIDSSYDPEPQLIAEAIAAFAANNQTRQQILCQRPLDSKIEVTAALVTAVAGGVYPEASTTVYAHIPNVPRPDRRWREGMEPFDSRAVIISCYEAFKKFVN